MKKNKKLLIGLLTIVIMAVIGLSAYAYQKQQTLNNKPKVEKKKEDSKLEKLIKDTTSKFYKENDLNKKIEIFKSLVDKKDEISKEKKDKLTSEYNDAIKKMREKISNSIKEKIKKATLSDDDKKNNEKVEAAKKELNDLQVLLDKEKSIIFEKNEDYDTVVQSIKDALTALEAPKSAESNQTQQSRETHSAPDAVEAPVSQPNTSSNSRSYNSNTSTYGSDSNYTYRPTTPSNNNTTSEPAGGNTRSTSTVTPPAPSETPSTQPTTTPGNTDSNANTSA